ncbi:MAG: CBS domain-containing protein [Nitrospira sp.]|nr:CBS domain-containing protein [Nitrospira sp.]
MPAKKNTVRAVKKPDVASITVDRVMETRVQSVHLRTKGDVIASLMIEGFGAVPVVDKRRKLVGIVTEHDLLAAIDDGHGLGSVAAGDIMVANPYAIRPETNVATLVHVLRASDLVRVPVVDEKDRLVGIIARRDVLRTYLSAGTSNKKRK